MSEVANLEQQLTTANELLKRRQAAIRLGQNPDFKQLFLEEYFKTEAARLVQMSTDPALTDVQRADALAMAQATGHTKRYLQMIVQMGAVSERELPELEEALAEARREEEENEEK